MNQHSTIDNFALRKLHEHPGYHPYRTILNEIRERLIATRAYMVLGIKLGYWGSSWGTDQELGH